jgi:hypothetical protein
MDDNIYIVPGQKPPYKQGSEREREAIYEEANFIPYLSTSGQASSY